MSFDYAINNTVVCTWQFWVWVIVAFFRKRKKTWQIGLCTENMWYTKVISIVTISILEIFGANSIQNSMRQTFYIKFFWYATFFAAKFDRCSQCRSDIWHCSVVKSKRSPSWLLCLGNVITNRISYNIVQFLRWTCITQITMSMIETLDSNIA